MGEGKGLLVDPTEILAFGAGSELRLVAEKCGYQPDPTMC